MTHHKYLQTNEWAMIRNAVLRRDGYCCRVYRTTGPLEAHHEKYPVEWRQDNPGNCVTLCQAHHDDRHRFKKASNGTIHISEVISDIMGAEHEKALA